MTFDGRRNTLLRTDFASVDPHLGIELGYGGFIYIRGGIGNIQRLTEFDGSENLTFQPNMGVGVKIKQFTLDYALTDVGDQSIAPLSNVFSLKFDIHKRGS